MLRAQRHPVDGGHRARARRPRLEAGGRRERPREDGRPRPRAGGLQEADRAPVIRDARGQDDAPDDKCGRRVLLRARGQDKHCAGAGRVLDRPEGHPDREPRGRRARPARLPRGGRAADPGLQDHRVQGVGELLVVHEAGPPLLQGDGRQREASSRPAGHLQRLNGVQRHPLLLKPPRHTDARIRARRRGHPRGERAGARPGPGRGGQDLLRPADELPGLTGGQPR